MRNINPLTVFNMKIKFLQIRLRTTHNTYLTKQRKKNNNNTSNMKTIQNVIHRYKVITKLIPKIYRTCTKKNLFLT